MHICFYRLTSRITESIAKSTYAVVRQKPASHASAICLIFRHFKEYQIYAISLSIILMNILFEAIEVADEAD